MTISGANLPCMDLKTYLEKSGATQAQLAERCGVTPSMVSQWISGHRPIAAEKVIPIELATDGLVRRHELRPDIYPPDEYAAA